MHVMNATRARTATNARRAAVRTAAVALAVGGLGLAAVGTASAAPSSSGAAGSPAAGASTSYVATSERVLISPEIGVTRAVRVSCESGYHVRGEFIYRGPNFGPARFEPYSDVTRDSGSDIKVQSTWAADHNGGGSDYSTWTYQTAQVILGNGAWATWEVGSAWVVCDPN